MRSVTALLVLAACSQAPAVTGVDPAEGLAGTEIDIVGGPFAPETTVRLESQGQATALSLAQQSSVVLHGAVPEGTAAGTYDVVIAGGGHEVRVPAAFQVKAPPVDAPCGHLYTANTTVNSVTGEIVVDRFYKDGERETVRIKLADVQRIELERVVTDDGLYCSVVYVKKNDGERIRYADDAKVDLKSRAYKFAQQLSKPIEVTREDPAPAAPAEGSEAKDGGQGEAAGG